MDNGSSEQEFYEEPPKMTFKDTAGVVVALIALAVIGYCGYIWITPDREFSTIFSRVEKESSSVQTAASATADVSTALRCEFCGMFAEKSASYIKVEWQDATVTHHDCWDCLMGHQLASSLSIKEVLVSSYLSPIGKPELLAANEAFYLFDTEEKVQGSMEPYVAAFKTKEAALEHQGHLGGTLQTYSDLIANWSKTGLEAQESQDSAEIEVTAQIDTQSAPGDSDDQDVATSSDSPLDLHAHHHKHEMNCTYCGMFSDRSLAHSVISWNDGSHTHHDCWDCAVFHGRENSLELEFAQVVDFSESEVTWLEAADSWFLYDTDVHIEGSMEPFVAAFGEKETAEAHLPELGGELVDFKNLLEKWN